MRAWRRFLVKVLAEVAPPNGSEFWMADIGAAGGGTTAACLRAYPRLRAYMIDPWAALPEYLESVKGIQPPEGFEQVYFDAAFLQAVEATDFAAGRRVMLRMRSSEAAPHIRAESLSLVFLDGMHTEDIVAADCRAYWPKLVLGGILCGHDYGNKHHPGVKAAVDKWIGSKGLPLAMADCARGVWVTRRPIA